MIPVGVAAFLAKPLVKKFLPWVLGGVAAAILLWVAVGKWNSYKEGLREEGRAQGRAEVTEQYRKQVAENNRVNREVEKQVGDKLTDFAEKIERERIERISNENRASRTIERTIIEQPQIFNNPACTVPQEVIDQRNTIRALGPKED